MVEPLLQHYSTYDAAGQLRSQPLSVQLTTIAGLDTATGMLHWSADGYPGLAAANPGAQVQPSTEQLHMGLQLQLNQQVLAAQTAAATAMHQHQPVLQPAVTQLLDYPAYQAAFLGYQQHLHQQQKRLAAPQLHAAGGTATAAAPPHAVAQGSGTVSNGSLPGNLAAPPAAAGAAVATAAPAPPAAAIGITHAQLLSAAQQVLQHSSLAAACEWSLCTWVLAGLPGTTNSHSSSSSSSSSRPQEAAAAGMDSRIHALQRLRLTDVWSPVDLQLEGPVPPVTLLALQHQLPSRTAAAAALPLELQLPNGMPAAASQVAAAMPPNGPAAGAGGGVAGTAPVQHPQPAACVRHVNPLLCPQGALGRYLAARFSNGLPPVLTGTPGPTSQQWASLGDHHSSRQLQLWDSSLLADSPAPGKHPQHAQQQQVGVLPAAAAGLPAAAAAETGMLTGGSSYEGVVEVALRQQGWQGAGRSSVLQLLERIRCSVQDGANSSSIRVITNISTSVDASNRCAAVQQLLSSCPLAALLAIAGWPSSTQHTPTHPRFSLPIPWGLKTAVFGFLPNFKAAVEGTGAGNMQLSSLLAALEYLAGVVVQDALVLAPVTPGNPLHAALLANQEFSSLLSSCSTSQLPRPHSTVPLSIPPAPGPTSQQPQQQHQQPPQHYLQPQNQQQPVAHQQPIQQQHPLQQQQQHLPIQQQQQPTQQPLISAEEGPSGPAPKRQRLLPGQGTPAPPAPAAVLLGPRPQLQLPGPATGTTTAGGASSSSQLQSAAVAQAAAAQQQPQQQLGRAPSLHAAAGSGGTSCMWLAGVLHQLSIIISECHARGPEFDELASHLTLALAAARKVPNITPRPVSAGQEALGLVHNSGAPTVMEAAAAAATAAAAVIHASTAGLNGHGPLNGRSHDPAARQPGSMYASQLAPEIPQQQLGPPGEADGGSSHLPPPKQLHVQPVQQLGATGAPASMWGSAATTQQQQQDVGGGPGAVSFTYPGGTGAASHSLAASRPHPEHLSDAAVRAALSKALSGVGDDDGIDTVLMGCEAMARILESRKAIAAAKQSAQAGGPQESTSSKEPRPFPALSAVGSLKRLWELWDMGDPATGQESYRQLEAQGPAWRKGHRKTWLEWRQAALAIEGQAAIEGVSGAVVAARLEQERLEALTPLSRFCKDLGRKWTVQQKLGVGGALPEMMQAAAAVAAAAVVASEQEGAQQGAHRSGRAGGDCEV